MIELFGEVIMKVERGYILKEKDKPEEKRVRHAK
jgi:hypothetical protein